MLIMTKSSLATMIGFFISITIGIILIPILKRKKQEQIINEYKDEPHGEERSDREILEEVLDLTRMYAKRAPRKFEARHALKRLLIALENIQMRGPLTNEHPFIEMHEELFPALEMLCMELECPSLFEEFMMRRNKYMHMMTR